MKCANRVYVFLPSNLVTAPCWLKTWWAISGYPRYLLDSSSSRECCWCCWLAAMAYSSRRVAGDGDDDGDADGCGLPAAVVAARREKKREWVINSINKKSTTKYLLSWSDYIQIIYYMGEGKNLKKKNWKEKNRKCRSGRKYK